MDQTPSTPSPSPNWIDLAITLGGIVLIFVTLSLGTAWLSQRWPHEQILLYLNGFATQLCFALLIIIMKIARKHSWADLGWRRVPIVPLWGPILGLYVLVWILNILYVSYLYARGLTPPSNDVYTQLFSNTTWLTFLLNVLLAGITAPLVEETLFRGIVFGGLQKYFGQWTAAVISAILFSGLHLQAYGFIPRFVLGLALATLYRRYRSLRPSVILHAINNLILVTLAFLPRPGA